MSKTLYFEGAGWFGAEHNGVGNCRIRTAFINKKGKKVYLELSRAPKYDEKHKQISEFALWIDYAFYITSPENDDCNSSRIKYDCQDIRDNYNYTIEDITKAVNKICNANFKTIEVLPQFEGYRVHGDGNREYNLIENHNVNIERAKAREEVYNEYDKKIRKILDSKYSKISMDEMNDDSITIKIYASDESMRKAGITERLHTLKVS